MINLDWDILAKMNDEEMKELAKPETREYIKELLPKHLISCPKCHGKGVYDVPAFEGDELKGYNPTLCELCNGTGKVTLEFYESIQKASREKK